ncbi:MAG: serine hydrolase domain-containing protein, partial [Nocardioidaceae bacterium]
LQYRIGSITKTLTAVALLQLREQGRVGLNDTLESHLAGRGYPAATLRALLSHSAGLPSEPAGAWWERNPGRSHAELVEHLLDEPAPFPPGATFHYTNVAYALLGEVVARVSGAGWWDTVRERILAPLGMDRTTYLPAAPHATGFSVHPYAGTLTPEPAYDSGAMAPAGQLWSTVADLARYAAFLAAGHDDVLPLRVLEEMTTPQSGSLASAASGGYGLGLRLVRGGSGLLVGHTGSMPGFLASLFVDRGRRTGAVLLANATTGLAPESAAVELLELLERCEPTVTPAWSPPETVPAAVEAVLGPWYWGNTALLFGWDGTEVVVTDLKGEVEFGFRPESDATFLGTRGYHHGERLRVEPLPGGASRLVCATFVFTRAPYAD